jgi:small conductance mechanosensitive channel
MNFELSHEFLQNLIQTLVLQIVNVIIILIIFTIIRKMGISLIKKLFSFKIGKLQRATPESLKQKETIKQLCINIFKYTINFLKLVFVISVFISIRTLMASVGAFAVVITFAFQSMLGDIVRGFFIIFEEMFMIGDWIEIAGFKGEVLEIGLRTTKLKLFDTKEIVLIPNNSIGNIVKLDLDRLIKEREKVQAEAQANA